MGRGSVHFLILLLGSVGLIIDVICLVVGAMLVALIRLLMLISIDGQLGRGRKLGCFIAAIPRRSDCRKARSPGECRPERSVGPVL